ncbi:hypothetical protein ACVV2G_10225 [Streptomyces ziwulingensis]
MVPLLSAFLIALAVFALGTPFASAHTNRDAMANACSGNTPSGAASHDATVTCHGAGRSGNPNGSPHVLDRHRTTTAPMHEAPEHPFLRERGPLVPEAAIPGRATGLRSRPAPDHSPATFQVLRH